MRASAAPEAPEARCPSRLQHENRAKPLLREIDNVEAQVGERRAAKTSVVECKHGLRRYTALIHSAADNGRMFFHDRAEELGCKQNNVNIISSKVAKNVF